MYVLLNSIYLTNNQALLCVHVQVTIFNKKYNVIFILYIYLCTNLHTHTHTYISASNSVEGHVVSLVIDKV
jgi:hypothetical protein